jgi:hypothetical protein
MIIRKHNQERLSRYRKAYPEDTRTDMQILKDLDAIKKDKRYMEKWIMKQVNENRINHD